jgi:hypothetical protein
MGRGGYYGEVFGYELVARALKNEGADTMFSLWAV